MKRLHRIPERLCGFACAAVTVLSLLMFAYVALYSLTQTCILDPDNFGGEVILFQDDGPVLSLLVTAAYALVAVGLYLLPAPRWQGYDAVVTTVVAAYALGLGFVWLYLCQSVPAADSGTVFDTACKVIAGDYTDFTTSNNDFYGNISYYQFYPFQLGYVFLSELLYRVCGTANAIPMQVVNVVALAAIYAGLMLWARRLFRDRRVTTLLAILLMGCLQPLFFTAFAYGNLPGFAAGLWAGYCAVCFMHSQHRGRLLWLLPTALLLVLAVLAKYNNMIWVLAVVIGLGLHLLHSRGWKLLPVLPVLLLLPVLAQQLVIRSYEVRSGVELGDGVSQLVYLRDGLLESNMAPGWYSDTGKSQFVHLKGDTAALDALAKEELAARLKELAADPAYTAEFFRKKLLSQWNEPTYESLWVSQVKGHYNGPVEEGTLLHSLYYGAHNRRVQVWFNLQQSAVLLLFCAGTAVLLYRRKTRLGPAAATLLTVLFGGGLYHLLFEAKSQYVLTYTVLLVFFAAYGLSAIGGAAAPALRRHLPSPGGRRKTPAPAPKE